MSFSSYKEKKDRETIEVELRVLEDSITDDMPAGDRKVIENRIEKLKKEIEVLEDTTSADIAGVERNLFAPCKNNPECECQKCKLLRKDKIAEAVQKASSFSNFFGK